MRIPRRAHESPARTLQNLAIEARELNLRQMEKSLAPLEDWHRVGSAGEPAFAPGWSRETNSEPNSGPHFRKDNEGFVYLTGRANWFGSASALGSRWSHPHAFTLPEGYRPQYRTYLGDPYLQTRTHSEGDNTYYWLPGSTIVETDGRVRPLGQRLFYDGMQDLVLGTPYGIPQVFRAASPNTQDI